MAVRCNLSARCSLAVRGSLCRDPPGPWSGQTRQPPSAAEGRRAAGRPGSAGRPALPPPAAVCPADARSLTRRLPPPRRRAAPQPLRAWPDGLPPPLTSADRRQSPVTGYRSSGHNIGTRGEAPVTGHRLSLVRSHIGTRGEAPVTSQRRQGRVSRSGRLGGGRAVTQSGQTGYSGPISAN